MHIIHNLGDKIVGLHRIESEQLFWSVLIKMWINEEKCVKHLTRERIEKWLKSVDDFGILHKYIRKYKFSSAERIEKTGVS